MANISDSKLVRGGQLTGAEAVRAKVKQDIAFFSDRITAMEQQIRPNQPVIDTYRTMLESRRSVLKWLEHGVDEAPSERTGT